MDRFKFRVWNIENKNFIYDAIYAYDGNNYGGKDNDGWIYCFGEYIDRNDEYIVEQCTGLKDKNGKLIYEGDIVKVISGKYEYLYKVIWEDCAFVLKPTSVNDWEDTKYLEDWLCSSEAFEVIGNIHVLEDK